MIVTCAEVGLKRRIEQAWGGMDRGSLESGGDATRAETERALVGGESPHSRIALACPHALLLRLVEGEEEAETNCDCSGSHEHGAEGRSFSGGRGFDGVNVSAKAHSGYA